VCQETFDAAHHGVRPADALPSQWRVFQETSEAKQERRIFFGKERN